MLRTCLKAKNLLDNLRSENNLRGQASSSKLKKYKNLTSVSFLFFNEVYDSREVYVMNIDTSNRDKNLEYNPKIVLQSLSTLANKGKIDRHSVDELSKIVVMDYISSLIDTKIMSYYDECISPYLMKTINRIYG